MPSQPDAARRPGDAKDGGTTDRTVRQTQKLGQPVPRLIEAVTGEVVRGTNTRSTTDVGRAVTRILCRANQVSLHQRTDFGALGELAKTDRIDAAMLQRYGQAFPELAPVAPHDAFITQLQDLMVCRQVKTAGALTL